MESLIIKQRTAENVGLGALSKESQRQVEIYLETLKTQYFTSTVTFTWLT